MDTIKTWKNHSGVLIDSVNGFDVVVCRECGFTHLLPLPLPTDLERMYRDEYYSQQKPDHIAQVCEGRQCHHKRVRFEQNLAAAGMSSVKRQLYEALARCGLGRQALFVARRTADDKALPV